MKEELQFVKRIEEMTDEQLRERIQYAMDYKIENPIKPIPYLGEVKSFVEYYYPEFSARCPMTNVKDLYKIKIKFIPDKFIPELKSLKVYFWGYENLPISHEHILAKVYKDFKETINPLALKIILFVAERGEMVTTIEYSDTYEDYGGNSIGSELACRINDLDIWKGREQKDESFGR